MIQGVESWRIVLVSQYVPALLGLDSIARAAGHRPVAHLCVRSRRERGELVEPFRGLFLDLVQGTPPDLDLLAPCEKARIAPLVRAYEADLLLCLGFPWLLPPEAIAAPRLGAVNVHPSLLPRYRGPFPVAWAVRNGESEIGITVHRMDERFDTGGILAQARVPLGEDDGDAEIFGGFAAVLQEILPSAFERVAAGDPGDPQDESEATWAGWPEPEFVRIDWNRSAREIHNQVRSWRLMPPMEERGALTELGGELVRVLRTRLRPGEGRKMQCSDGPIWILQTESAETEAG